MNDSVKTQHHYYNGYVKDVYILCCKISSDVSMLTS